MVFGSIPSLDQLFSTFSVSTFRFQIASRSLLDDFRALDELWRDSERKNFLVVIGHARLLLTEPSRVAVPASSRRPQKRPVSYESNRSSSGSKKASRDKARSQSQLATSCHQRLLEIRDERPTRDSRKTSR